MKDYLAFNDTGNVSDSTLWEAFKVVIRGFVLSYEAAEKNRGDKVNSYRSTACAP